MMMVVCHVDVRVVAAVVDCCCCIVVTSTMRIDLRTLRLVWPRLMVNLHCDERKEKVAFGGGGGREGEVVGND